MARRKHKKQIRMRKGELLIPIFGGLLIWLFLTMLGNGQTTVPATLGYALCLGALGYALFNVRDGDDGIMGWVMVGAVGIGIFWLVAMGLGANPDLPSRLLGIEDWPGLTEYLSNH